MSDLELLDCGGGRRLERFGSVVVDRPAPAAREPARLPAGDWARAHLRWDRGAWARGGDRAPWVVRAGGLALECRPAAGGQVGLFPEHAALWPWLRTETEAATVRLGRPLEILSLFAYTGGASLACAAGGARVVHVDASRPAVGWGRANAARSGLDDRPVRWLVDDARDFVRRERRRGRRYDGVVLDPPSWGHGEGAWKLDDHLAPLLADLAALTGPRPALVLLTAHTPGWDAARLGALLRDHVEVACHESPLELVARSGARLAVGAAVRALDAHSGRRP